MVIRMRANYLPKFAVGVLVLAAMLIMLSGQSAQVAASPSMTAHSYAYPYANSTYSHHYHHYSYFSYPYYYYYYCGYPYYYSYSYPDYCYYGYNYYDYYGYYSYPYSYYYGYPYNYYSYYSTPSQYQLTVATDPANLAPVTGGGTYSRGSSASFSVSQTTVQSSPNTRYVFSHWSGDYSGAGSSGTVTVNSAMKVTAVYQLQYYLTISSQPGGAPTPQGAGWYNAGDTASLTASSQPMGDSSSRLVFDGWSVDGQGPQSGTSLSVAMNAPHSVTALYKQQYYLNVVSEQGVPYGQGWYDAGSTAQISVSNPVSTQYGVNIVFNGWQGDVQSNSQSTSVQMDKAKTAIASWRTDSTVLYLTIAAGIIAVVVAAAVVAVLASGRNRSSSVTQVTRHETVPSENHPTHTKKKTDPNPDTP
jgi:hypothetical protein